MKKAFFKIFGFREDESGFALLFAVLVASVLLSIGASIFNLTLKELTLSSSGRESQFAFYAADTGAECALYWDFKATPLYVFATSSASQASSWRDSYIDSMSPTCAGGSISASVKTPISTSALSAVTQITLNIPNASPEFCAIITVTKSASSPGGVISTVIESRGYNTPCASTDSNKIERGLRVSY